MQWKLDVAKFAGQCMKCGKSYNIGDPIAYRKNDNGYWERVHSGCLTLSEMQQRSLPEEMPKEAPRTAASAPLEAKPCPSTSEVVDRLDLAVIALIEISKTLRAIEEKMRK